MHAACSWRPEARRRPRTIHADWEPNSYLATHAFDQTFCNVQWSWTINLQSKVRTQDEYTALSMGGTLALSRGLSRLGYDDRAGTLAVTCAGGRGRGRGRDTDLDSGPKRTGSGPRPGRGL